ncbi:MAG: Bro-N domain-containing protein [Scytonema sp. PMC 1069.18]|nr:Bro-N domain-containing protein [Scytonema sp. PMC 1069.18]MEC4886045.1 Bro-N domain-containing protein [Scytonema sp. PMC 1070.18]
MSNIVPFSFESQEVRVLIIDSKPWFVAADVTKVLSIGRTQELLRVLDDDEKGVHTIHTLGGNQEVAIISESGLYHAIIKSRKPQAKPFRKWVTSEVLPAIRTTGSYSLEQPQPPMTQIQILAAVAQQMVQQEQKLIEQERKQQEIETRLEAVEVEQDRYSSPSGHNYTVLGFACKQGMKMSINEARSKGMQASIMCRQRGIKIERINDPRFGKVGLYPESILIEVFAQ